MMPPLLVDRRRRRRLLRAGVAAVVTALVASLLTVGSATTEADAAESSRWDPGNIVSDAAFFDGNAMNAGDVQAFLNAQQRGCAAGATCLNGYSQSTPTMSANAYCGAYPGSASHSAATIIATVGRVCGISPRVLLVLLQKEQTLVTSQNPSPRQYTAATGFACPDTAPCDSLYGGFFYQVYYAARQFKVYQQFPASFNHRPGQWNTVLYHPNSACGSGRVLIQNQATAGLYNYTPYQPNAAAMANLYGTGDSCSAYGNRNFWRMWTDWFGDPTGGAGNPIGRLELVAAEPGTVRVSGWAVDPDAPTEPLDVHVYIGSAGSSHVANLARPDLPAAYGPNHGYDIRLQVGVGVQRVCVILINKGSGGNVGYDCVDLRVSQTGESGAPRGNLEIVSGGDGTIRVAGWANDPDVRSTVPVHVYVGSTGTAHATGVARPDVAGAYPRQGGNQGFDITVPSPGGLQNACAYAIDSTGDGNTLLGCREVFVRGSVSGNGAPFGSIDSVQSNREGTGISFSGWAIDPNTQAPVPIHAYIGSRGVAYMADKSRPDVGAVHRAYGPNHGFSETLSTGPGTHRICLYALDVVGGNGNVELGCRDVTVAPPTGRSGSPIGSLEAVTAVQGGVRVSGWGFDPDTAQPATIAVSVDGVRTDVVANQPRADVGAAHPTLGPNHGFQSVVNAGPGSHRVCVTVIDRAGGHPNADLGCRTVVVPAATGATGSPFGNLEAISAVPGGASISGWVIDPDTALPTDFHVYVNGAGYGAYTASAERSDVARSYPAYGSAHGISQRISLNPGRYDVCVFGIDTAGSGSNVLMGCRTVTVG